MAHLKAGKKIAIGGFPGLAVPQTEMAADPAKQRSGSSRPEITSMRDRSQVDERAARSNGC
ncbi:hypothetical protein [Labrys okinawensis]|uniref:hypothetical protein n=1 Tax=Labrys okinawensis TaxID=346911 RepID=UPI0011B1DF3C|nr:hypothetical protein [Labrys okinawensis]